VSDHRIIDTLIAAGFVSHDGILSAPGARFTLTPIGNFVELRIELLSGTSVRAVMAAEALKIATAAKPTSPEPTCERSQIAPVAPANAVEPSQRGWYRNYLASPEWAATHGGLRPLAACRATFAAAIRLGSALRPARLRWASGRVLNCETVRCSCSGTVSHPIGMKGACLMGYPIIIRLRVGLKPSRCKRLPVRGSRACPDVPRRLGHGRCR
jgi:hypothetical protein